MSTFNSRELIIERAAKNKPGQSALPDISIFEKNIKGSLETFSAVLKSIGGTVHLIQNLEELVSIVTSNYSNGRFYSPVDEIKKLIKQMPADTTDGHDLENVELAIVKAHFGVAENGAVLITDDLMENRTLPFICQHLAVIINEDDILPTMHQAYLHTAVRNYNYGTFIAGPSKTADIEQSLVLGAHGPKSMAVFILSK